MICFPNAKINLGLHILSKRPDGYHNIESVLYPVPVRDALEFLPSNNEFQLTLSGIHISGKKENNLIYKAWELLRTHFNVPPLSIHLHKAIPPGSGLGGGSSDAAFFIQAANTIFNLEMSFDEIKNTASRLGSDCPFFIENKPALVTGKGEILQTIPLSLKGMQLLVVQPGIHISTAEAYRLAQPQKPESNMLKIISLPPERWKGLLINDFEKPLFQLHPELGEIKNSLYKLGAVYASLTGSGSAVFGIFNKQPPIKNINPNYYIWSGKL